MFDQFIDSPFIWGALVAIGIRGGACRVCRFPMLYKAHQYIPLMFGTGLACSFFDWARRMNLEDLCAQEDMAELETRYARMNYLDMGNQKLAQESKEFNQMSVDEHIY